MSDSSGETITVYLGIFEEKLDKLKNKLKQEIEKPKEERSKKVLKQLVREARSLRNTVRNMRRENEMHITCPHCNKDFTL